MHWHLGKWGEYLLKAAFTPLKEVEEVYLIFVFLVSPYLSFAG